MIHQWQYLVSRESLPDAELREDHIQQVFHIDPARQPAKRLASTAAALPPAVRFVFHVKSKALEHAVAHALPKAAPVCRCRTGTISPIWPRVPARKLCNHATQISNARAVLQRKPRHHTNPGGRSLASDRPSSQPEKPALRHQVRARVLGRNIFHKQHQITRSAAPKRLFNAQRLDASGVLTYPSGVH